jgi:hypothetical protein
MGLAAGGLLVVWSMSQRMSQSHRSRYRYGTPKATHWSLAHDAYFVIARESESETTFSSVAIHLNNNIRRCSRTCKMRQPSYETTCRDESDNTACRRRLAVPNRRRPWYAIASYWTVVQVGYSGSGKLVPCASAYVLKTGVITRNRRPFVPTSTGTAQRSIVQTATVLEPRVPLPTNHAIRSGTDPSDVVGPLLRKMGMDKNLSKWEASVMSATGIALTLGVLYSLAVNGEDVTAAGPAATTLETFELASLNIVDAALPLTATDIVSVAAGEAMAGILGAAVASLGVSTAMPPPISRPLAPATRPVLTRSNKSPEITTSSTLVRGVKVSDAVADGDFLLTTAAAKQLLGVVGVSPFLASLAATALAIVPYSLVKVGARRREREIQETALMDQLLADEQTRQRRTKLGLGPIVRGKNARNEYALPRASTTIVDPNQLTPVLGDKPKLDWVETFADIVKWLAFDVLRSDFGGHLMWNGELLFFGLESAIIGWVTGLTIQVYADVLYAYFGLGGETMKNLVRARTVQETTSIYLSKSAYCAILFGVYDTAQIPAKALITALSSGGVDACVGSNNFGYCIETFVTNNPIGASPEAELRSLATAVVSLWNNYGIPSWSTL